MKQTDSRSVYTPPVTPPMQEKPVYVMPKPRHGQYDAVLKRMKAAQKQTGHYSAWT